MFSDDQEKDVKLDVSQALFEALSDASQTASFTALCKEHTMLGFYQHGMQVLGQNPDQALVASMQKNIAAKRKQLLEEIEKAEKEEGDLEVSQLQLQVAQFAGFHATKEEALKAYGEIQMKV